jgi:hypothetical protein
VGMVVCTYSPSYLRGLLDLRSSMTAWTAYQDLVSKKEKREETDHERKERG